MEEIVVWSMHDREDCPVKPLEGPTGDEHEYDIGIRVNHEVEIRNHNNNLA